MEEKSNKKDMRQTENKQAAGVKSILSAIMLYVNLFKSPFKTRRLAHCIKI